MKISDRYQRLLARRAPSDDRRVLRFAESFEQEPGENTKYLLGAMRPVEAKYTQRLQEQGNRVQNQLRTGLKESYPGLEFQRQGSVSNLTHIKFYSDVDVLAIIDKFETLERPQIPDDPYLGVPEDDLLALRRACLSHLKTAFPTVSFDDAGATAIGMSEGSLACRVDVVPANWLNTNDYARTGLLQDRGVQVLIRDTMTRRANYPFRFNARIEDMDTRRRGTTRMFIRLLKTIRADLEEDEKATLEISSFDLCSVVYRMPGEYFAFALNQPLDLIRNLLLWMQSVIESQAVRDSLQVVDDTRDIFDAGGKLPAFHRVFNELCSVYDGAVKEHGSQSVLTEAHIR